MYRNITIPKFYEIITIVMDINISKVTKALYTVPNTLNLLMLDNTECYTLLVISINFVLFFGSQPLSLKAIFSHPCLFFLFTNPLFLLVFVLMEPMAYLFKFCIFSL